MVTIGWAYSARRVRDRCVSATTVLPLPHRGRTEPLAGQELCDFVQLRLAPVSAGPRSRAHAYIVKSVCALSIIIWHHDQARFIDRVRRGFEAGRGFDG